MQWQNRIIFFSKAALIMFLVAASGPLAHSGKVTVRTPAKHLGERFTVNIELRRGKMKYVVPFFVDPTRKVSILDERQFKSLAWVGINPVWNEVLMSGYKLPITQFKNGDAEEAFMPNFVRSCCYGILGQDILNQFQVVAFDDVPAYIEWFKIEEGSGIKPTWFEREKNYLWETLDNQIFNFKLVAPERRAFLAQAWNGIPAGSRWLRVQGKDPQYVDKYYLEKYLKGRVDQMLELEFQVGKEIKKIVHEFKWKNPS